MEDAHWLADWDLNDGTIEPQVTWSERFVAQIATVACESTTFQEAVRMLLQQGIWMRKREPSGSEAPIGPGPEFPAPDAQHLWYEHLNFSEGKLTKKVELTRGQVEQLADVIPHAPNIQEAMWLAIGLAIAARQADIRSTDASTADGSA